MSAYIVSDRDINYIVSFALAAKVYLNGRPMQTKQDGQHLANLLLTANYASVNTRYRENNCHGIKFEQSFEDFKPVEILKALDCFDYQACEVADYEKTEAALAINRIRCAAISRLPGYKSAPWGAPPEPDVKRISIMDMIGSRA